VRTFASQSFINFKVCFIRREYGAIYEQDSREVGGQGRSSGCGGLAGQQFGVGV